MAKEKFDLDKFIDSIEAEDLPELDEESRYQECPRCGSETWDKLHYNKRGKISCCNECKEQHEQ